MSNKYDIIQLIMWFIMRIKNLLLICILLLATITIWVVSAAEDTNVTETDYNKYFIADAPLSTGNYDKLQLTEDEISSERESQLKKSDFNATIYNIKDNYAKGAIYTTTYTVRINNLPKDHPNDRFEVFVDGKFYLNVTSGSFSLNRISSPEPHIP